jgi:hypothetical protein
MEKQLKWPRHGTAGPAADGRHKQVAVQRRMSARHPTGEVQSRVYRKEVAVDQSSVQVSSIDLRLGRRQLPRHSRALLTPPAFISDAEVPPPEDDAPTTRCTLSANPGPHYWHRSFRLIRPRKLQAFRSRFFPSSVRSSGRSFSCCAPSLKLKKKRPRACQPVQCAPAFLPSVASSFLGCCSDDRAAIHRFSPCRPLGLPAASCASFSFCRPIALRRPAVSADDAKVSAASS